MDIYGTKDTCDMYTHTHTRTRTHTHKHTHTQTHTQHTELKFTVYSIVQGQNTPLHRAASNGHSGTAQVLVEAKADVDAGNVV